MDGFVGHSFSRHGALMICTNLDAPMFNPANFRLTSHQNELIALARRLGPAFAQRAERYDREAIFPVENFADLRDAGLLGICVPAEAGGLGADFRSYCLVAAEIGRYCASTALAWNMHVCTAFFAGQLADDLDMDAGTRQVHAQRRARIFDLITHRGAIFAQPFSEGSAARSKGNPFPLQATPVEGGWRLTGKKIFVSSAQNADVYGILCTEEGTERLLYLAVEAKSPGVSCHGDWNPLGMRGTVSRNVILENVFAASDAHIMPPDTFAQATTRWPHLFLTLSCGFLGIAQATYDFTLKFLRGEVEGVSASPHYRAPVKQHAVSTMRVKLEQLKALWFQAVSEAHVDPSHEQLVRAYAAHTTATETAAELSALAIRTCGGHAILRTFPLERLYRDSRCGSLIAPWTADACLDRIGQAELGVEPA